MNENKPMSMIKCGPDRWSVKAVWGIPEVCYCGRICGKGRFWAWTERV